MLIDFRERGSEGEKEGEKRGLVPTCMCPKQGPKPQPGRVP